MNDSLQARADHRGHSCLPFETEDEKRDAVLAFMRDGLARGARCQFIGTAPEFDDLVRSLELSGVCSARARARGALTFSTPEDTYLTNGVFDPEQVIARVHAKLDAALAAGFTALWGTGEFMTAPTDEDWRRIVWYEAEVNEHFGRLPLAGQCRYPRAAVPPARVRDVLRTHPIAIVRGELCDNPFYERPEIVLSDDSQARLEWQLRQLRVGQRRRERLEDQTISAVAAAGALAAELQELRSALSKH